MRSDLIVALAGSTRDDVTKDVRMKDQRQPYKIAVLSTLLAMLLAGCSTTSQDKAGASPLPRWPDYVKQALVMEAF